MNTRNVEWLDCHVHVLNGTARDVEAAASSQRELGYTAGNFLSVEGMDDAAQNALAIYYKLIDPANYAFGGLHYRFAYDFAAEAETLHRIGLDGIKMIENKPTERKRLGYAQDDPRYDALYRKMTELDMPLLVHVNDPAQFWDAQACPDWARENGWFYGDGSYVGYEQLVRECIAMLEKHPHLRVCFAHLFFMSEDEPELRRLLARFPNVMLDLTPGTEMYYSFDRDSSVWRRFFSDHRERVMFGTDNCYPASDRERSIAAQLNELERNYLTRSDRFPLWDRTIQGAGLPEDVVRKIASDNFRRFAGEKPRPLQIGEAIAYLTRRMENIAFRLTKTEQETIKTVISKLKSA